MNTKEHKAYIEDIQKYTKEVLSSEAKTKSFLQTAGIHTKTGKLSSHYTGNSKKVNTNTK